MNSKIDGKNLFIFYGFCRIWRNDFFSKSQFFRINFISYVSMKVEMQYNLFEMNSFSDNTFNSII